jgi:hypothetical protein
MSESWRCDARGRETNHGRRFIGVLIVLLSEKGVIVQGANRRVGGEKRGVICVVQRGCSLVGANFWSGHFASS